MRAVHRQVLSLFVGCFPTVDAATRALDVLDMALFDACVQHAAGGLKQVRSMPRGMAVAVCRNPIQSNPPLTLLIVTLLSPICCHCRWKPHPSPRRRWWLAHVCIRDDAFKCIIFDLCTTHLRRFAGQCPPSFFSMLVVVVCSSLINFSGGGRVQRKSAPPDGRLREVAAGASGGPQAVRLLRRADGQEPMRVVPVHVVLLRGAPGACVRASAWRLFAALSLSLIAAAGCCCSALPFLRFGVLWFWRKQSPPPLLQHRLRVNKQASKRITAVHACVRVHTGR